MHRTNFRSRRAASNAPVRDERITQSTSPPPPPINHDFSDIRAQIASLNEKISPIAALATKKPDEALPADLHKSVQLLHGRLDRIEKEQKEQNAQQKRAETAFSNAILKLAEQVEKISGGEDVDFSLAQSLDTLIKVLESQKFRIVRDSYGNMTALETV